MVTGWGAELRHALDAPGGALPAALPPAERAWAWSPAACGAGLAAAVCASARPAGAASAVNRSKSLKRTLIPTKNPVFRDS